MRNARESSHAHEADEQWAKREEEHCSENCCQRGDNGLVRVVEHDLTSTEDDKSGRVWKCAARVSGTVGIKCKTHKCEKISLCARTHRILLVIDVVGREGEGVAANTSGLESSTQTHHGQWSVAIDEELPPGC